MMIDAVALHVAFRKKAESRATNAAYDHEGVLTRETLALALACIQSMAEALIEEDIGSVALTRFAEHVGVKASELLIWKTLDGAKTPLATIGLSPEPQGEAADTFTATEGAGALS